MFRINKVENEQISIFSRETAWSNYQRKRLEESWVGYFRYHIFPNINEEPFRVLYSEDTASCPNTPINILVSLLVIKSIKHVSDEELIDLLLFDERVQYALHTSHLTKQPISKNMLSNFRTNCKKYLEETGIDLLDICLREINDNIIKLHEVDRSLERIDSLMISSSCKRLSRIELIYQVNYNFIKMLDKYEKVPTQYKEYLEKGNKNDVIYRTRESEEETKLETLIKHSLELYDEFKSDIEVNQTEEFKLLERLIEEQYDSENKKPKDGKEITSTSLQNPTDKDATYRYKYEGNQGYVGNIVEAINEGKPMITDWEVAQNITSDVDLINNYLDKLSDNQQEIKIEIVDGAYYTEDTKKKAEEKGIELHPTELVGRKGKETNITEFRIDEKKHQILECQNKQVPDFQKYDKEKEMIIAKFSKEKCKNCPFKDKCIMSEKAKKMNTVRLNKTALNRAEIMKERNTEEYKRISNMRAGIEGIPSVLRRFYQIDKRQTKGILRLKWEFSTSIVSINIKRGVKMDSIMGQISVFIKKISFLPSTHFIFFNWRIPKFFVFGT